MGTSAGQMTDIVQVGAILSRLADTLQLPAQAASQMRVLAEGLIGPLGENGIPLSFSVNLDAEEPEIHVLWDSARSPRDFGERVNVALQAQQRMQEVFGVSSSRFERIRPLFLGEGGEGSFALLYCARLWPATKPHKITAYVNPQVLGRLNAPALVEDAFERLGFTKAWLTVSSAMSRGAELDEVLCFGLELSADDAAPAEVWIRHHEATAEVIAEAAKSTPKPAPLGEFFRSVAGDRVDAGTYGDTRLSLIAGGGPTATAATLHVPVRGSVEPDGQVEARVLGALGESAAKRRRAVLEAVSRQPLDAGLCLTTSSLRAGVRVSIETSGSSPQGKPTAPTAVAPPVEVIVAEYEAQPFSLHPFLQRMARGPVDLQQMWLMFSNVYAGLAQHFPRRLARVVLGVEDEHIRCILAEQLYEELGSGDYTRTHRRLFVRLLETLAPWSPATITPEMSTPGINLSERLEAVYFDPHPYAGVGAAIVIELLGKQVDVFIAAQFRRQQVVPMSSLEWLTQHETLELDHADESHDLATLIERDDDRIAAWRGGHAVHAAGWLFFDDMYRLCFGT